MENNPMNATKFLTALVFAASLATGASAATATKPAKVAKVHTPESIECTKQADAKGLHGGERKKFRSACKKEMMGKHSSAASVAPAKPAPVKAAVKPAPSAAAKAN
jgi:psiF repeat